MKQLHFQDIEWDIPELQGLKCCSFFGLSENGTEFNPDIIFIELSNGVWYRYFISAFLGFWSETELADLAAVIDEDFAGYFRIDYLKKYGLEGQTLKQVKCETTGEGVLIILKFGMGYFIIKPTDKSDPHSESVFSFSPNKDLNY
jgi:hypothetical protein